MTFDSIILTFRRLYRRGLPVVAAIATVASLGGCSSVPDAANPVEWYKGTRDWIIGDDGRKTAGKDDARPVAGADRPFPKLDTVPARPVDTTEAERKQMANSLTADREAARYTDEQIRRQSSAVAADTRSGPVSAAAAATAAPIPQPQAPAIARSAAPTPPRTTRRGPAVMNQTASVDPTATQLPPVSSVPPGSVSPRARASASPPRAPAAPPPPAISPVVAAGQPIPVYPSPGFAEAPLPGSEFPYSGTAGLPPNVRIAHSQQRSTPVAANRFSPRFPPGANAIAGPRAVTPTLPQFASLPPELDVSPSAGFAPGAVIPPSSGVTPGLPLSFGAEPVATLRFGVGSSKIGPQGRRMIRQAYQAYQSFGGRIHVVGHASSRTRNLDRARHELANFRVSYDRAKAVAQELIRLGVDPSRVVVSAVSDHQPAFIEVMPAGEAGNRRAEIIFAN